jgi:hypothetical protein
MLPNTVDLTGIFLPKVVVTDGYAFVGDSLGFFHVVDISPISEAEIINTIDLDEYVRDMVIESDFVYIIHFPEGFKVIDINMPTSPTVVASLPMKYICMAIGVEDGTACVISEGYGLQVIDVSLPHLPQHAADIYSLTVVYQMAVDGDYLYVTSPSQYVPVYDITEPQHPEFFNLYEHCPINDIEMRGEYAITARNDGFAVMLLDPLSGLLTLTLIPMPDYYPILITLGKNYAYCRALEPG